MAVILNLETSTKNCSVCISRGVEVLSLVEQSSDQYIHSEKLHLFIQEAFRESGLESADLDAVAVGKGPGSYTGLRIGVSTAKGFCYALGIPLIAEDGLSILVQSFLSHRQIGASDQIVPMLDARRMEVYRAVYNGTGKKLLPIEAQVVDESSFTDLTAGQVHLIGDAVEKCSAVLSDTRFVFHDVKYPSAHSLAQLANVKFEKRQFEDVAYFEPFYLKDFVAGKPRKLL